MWARHSDSQRGSPRRGERARWQLPPSEARGAPLTGHGKVDKLWHQANSGLNPALLLTTWRSWGSY